MDSSVFQTFRKSKQIVFLTGAGVSTPSGIPDYRSKNGLYHQKSKHKSVEWYLSHDCLKHRPNVFHRFMKKYMYHPDAKPNIIHQVQAKLTRLNRASIITQNVDNLYQRAHVNSKRLVEFHGNLYHCYCQKCHQQISCQRYLKNPVHHQDGGQIRPDLVLYGEGISQKSTQRSMHIMLNADLIVIVGTTMKVEPFADLIKYHQPNVPIIAINEQPLRFSYNVGLTMIQTNAVDFFNRLATQL